MRASRSGRWWCFEGGSEGPAPRAPRDTSTRMKTPAVSIRPVRRDDEDALWDMLRPVIEAGETYTFPRDLGRDEALAYWLSAAHAAHIAEIDGVPVGTYWLRPNQPGGGDHVCNCAYVTASGAEGRGVGRTMLAHSLELARVRGYRAMPVQLRRRPRTHAPSRPGSGRAFGRGRLPGAFLHPARRFRRCAGDVEGPRRLSFPCRSSRNTRRALRHRQRQRGGGRLVIGMSRPAHAPQARRNPASEVLKSSRYSVSSLISPSQR